MTPVRSAKHRPLPVIVAILLASAALFSIAGPASAAAPVSLIELDSAITPVTVRLLAGAIERAHAEGAPALIVQLNTPGGRERAMRSMVQSILTSPLPGVVYGAPRGRRRPSAGGFIPIAAHLA